MYPNERSLVEKMKNKPFVLLGVNSDPKVRLREVLKKENITWRSWWDGGDTGGPIASKWNVTGWPTVYLLDAKGVIRNKFVGVDEGTLNRSIEGLMRETEAGGGQ